MDQYDVRTRDVRVELQKIFPHGFVESLADVRQVLTALGRKEAAAADAIRVRRFFESRAMQRGESKLRWADLLEYLESA
jgi:repressor of nif and glnA expression